MHTSHFTQPLDVGCFNALEKYYRDGVDTLCQGGAKIQKRTFLDIYDAARTRALTVSNIDRGWRGFGLYPLYPETVLSNVHTQERTPPQADNQSIERDAGCKKSIRLTQQGRCISMSLIFYQ